MKHLIILIALFLSFGLHAQTPKLPLTTGERIGLKLDSLAKAYDVKHISVYFHVASTWMSDLRVEDMNKTSVASHLIGEYSEWKFEGPLVIFTDPAEKDAVRYYNLEKMVHFTATKGKNIRIYFQF
jgi:hypothetical protein